MYVFADRWRRWVCTVLRLTFGGFLWIFADIVRYIYLLTYLLTSGVCTSTSWVHIMYVADRPRVVNMPERLYLPRGLLGRVDCHVEANPPQTVIVWSKDGRLMDLENARHIRVSRHGALLIKPVSVYDEGKYTCTPYSALGPGQTSRAVQVFVRGDN